MTLCDHVTNYYISVSAEMHCCLTSSSEQHLLLASLMRLLIATPVCINYFRKQILDCGSGGGKCIIMTQ